MEFVELSPAEKQIVEILRTLKPFERVEFVGDNTGKPDSYFIHRSTKAILRGSAMLFVK